MAVEGEGFGEGPYGLVPFGGVLLPGLHVAPFVDAPCPRVGITLTGLDATGPSRVTLYRSTAGGQRRIVRGWDKRLVYGSEYSIDYEAPLGREVVYTLEVNAGAVIPPMLLDTTFLDVPTGFIQDPLLPLGAIGLSSGLEVDQVPVLTDSVFRKLQYDIESSSVKIMGSREPVAMTGQRMVASGIDFSVFTEAAEHATALRSLLMEGGIVLVRPLPSWGPLPDLLYTVPSVSEEPVYAEDGVTFTRWTMSGDSVRPPSVDILVALWTYNQVAALWTTYQSAQDAANAAGYRYLDVQRDPTMGA